MHLNPVEAGIVSVERVGEYRWSSLRLFDRRDRPAWLEASTILAESGDLADTRAGWRSYCDYLGLRWEKDPVMRERRFAELTRTWAVGSTAFRAELRQRLGGGEDRRERFSLLGADHEAVLAARAELWEAELRQWAKAFDIALDRLPAKKSAEEKLLLATAMKSSTSVSRAWLAQRLQMGVADGLGSLLHRFRLSGALDRPEVRRVLFRFPA